MKKNPADINAEKYLEIQLQKSSNIKAFDIVLIFIALLFISIFGLLTLILPKKDFSYDENRVLQTFPKFSLEKIVNGSFESELSKFYSDQFPLRKNFVELKTILELSALRMENNDVIFAGNGYLIKKTEYSDYSNIVKNIDAIEELKKRIDIPLDCVFLPRTIDVVKGKNVPIFDYFHTDKVWELVEDSNADVTILNDYYEKLSNLDIYYRTDHHQTTLGAYYTYVAISENLNYSPKPISYFSRQTVTENFLGTTYSKSPISSIKPDKIELFRFQGDNDFTIEIVDTDEYKQGFYNMNALSEKDKYSVFLSGNHGHIKIYPTDESARAEKETLLIFKDSFANALAPFLAIHYNLEIIDLRYFDYSTDIMKDINPDRILILYGIDSVATSDNLASILRVFK